MEAGGSQGRVNPNTFSLTELSLLMRILDRIHLPEIYYSAESTSIENVFRQKGGQVLASIGLSENDRMVIDFRLKIRAVSKAIEICLIHTQYRDENSGILKESNR